MKATFEQTLNAAGILGNHAYEAKAEGILPNLQAMRSGIPGSAVSAGRLEVGFLL